MIRKLVFAALLASVPSMALSQPGGQPAIAASSDQGRDLASIKAMAGTFKVTFDMRETVPFVTDYTPLPAKMSGGFTCS